MPHLYFITGACGAGKSSILPYLKNRFKKFDINDFDEMGVPVNPTAKWRRQTTSYWLNRALNNNKKGISTIIVGLLIPKEVKGLVKERFRMPIHFCLLDMNKKVRAKRLKERGASEELIEDLEELIGFKKWIIESDFNCFIVNTSNLTVKEVSNKVIKWISGIENRFKMKTKK